MTTSFEEAFINAAKVKHNKELFVVKVKKWKALYKGGDCPFESDRYFESSDEAKEVYGPRFLRLIPNSVVEFEE